MKRAGVIVMVVLFLAGMGAWLWFHPEVSVRVRRSLVGPEDKAMELLWQDAPLDEIKSAVQKSGKDVDQISALGGSLLYWAADKGRIDVARWLLAQGAEPDGIHPGSRPLMAAVFKENTTMVRLLIEHGADPDLKTPIGVGETVRQIAERRGNPEILAALPPTEEPQGESVSNPPGRDLSDGSSGVQGT